jgi:hypothetical protein
MKIIRSAGTPCSMRTSTALIADPPVAVFMQNGIRKIECRQRGMEHVIETHLTSDQATTHIVSPYLMEIWSRITWPVQSLHPGRRFCEFPMRPVRFRLLSHSLNQDFADSNTSTDFAKTSFHSLHTTATHSIKLVN